MLILILLASNAFFVAFIVFLVNHIIGKTGGFNRSFVKETIFCAVLSAAFLLSGILLFRAYINDLFSSFGLNPSGGSTYQVTSTPIPSPPASSVDDSAAEDAASDDSTAVSSSASESASNTDNGYTISQNNAIRAAETYLASMPFSREGLIQQLSSEYGSQFPLDDAEFAVNYLEENNLVDWNEQAVKAAESYMNSMAYSRDSLVQQLSSEAGSKFTPKQAEYAASQIFD